MSKYKIKPLKPQGLRTSPHRSLKGKVTTFHFAEPFLPSGSFESFLAGLPDVLAARDLNNFVSLLRNAKKRKKPILCALGAHPIKVGLNPVLIDLMREGWISGLALNGAGIIHDFEIAFSGYTSEDVGRQIKHGGFGMSRETGTKLNEAISADQDNLGLGEIVGKLLESSGFPFKHLSLLATAYELNIPVTVHVAIGTDTIHFHPKVSGQALGKTSLRDFFLFCSLVKGLNDGGVFLNIGSAVVLPEVFLKAVSFIRNKGSVLDGFSTAVFDFIHHYRPDQNVVKRPLGKKGKGYYFIGHHELMIPLLAAALKSNS
ncbi:MAG: hypothetical protein MUP98_05235 [Candidatus Aminicenantes bacterium]|nr:hypothetical protein [Candidatus Aminicenantes bacterium]